MMAIDTVDDGDVQEMLRAQPLSCKRIRDRKRRWT